MKNTFFKDKIEKDGFVVLNSEQQTDEMQLCSDKDYSDCCHQRCHLNPYGPCNEYWVEYNKDRDLNEINNTNDINSILNIQ